MEKEGCYLVSFVCLCEGGWGGGLPMHAIMIGVRRESGFVFLAPLKAVAITLEMTKALRVVGMA